MHSGAELGRRLRAADASDPRSEVLIALAAGEAVARDPLARALSEELVSELVAERLLRPNSGMLALPYALGRANDVIFAAPDPDAAERGAPCPDFLYLGPDSGYLVDAARRLAPRGVRAVDLGAGTGLLASMLSATYETVVATDIVERVAAAADLTLALAERPSTHTAAAVVADVAAGLRTAAFDLVTANPPWVPTGAGAARRVFADGGATGTELPCRVVREAAELLRPGGTAVVLALDVCCDGDRRPLREVCAELSAEGYTTSIVPTPLGRMLPDLEAQMRRRQPRIVTAEHVVIVVAAPFAAGGMRHAALVAAEGLAREWAAWSPAPDGR
jgi:methylase of polypeptide subunit release factors